MLAIGLLISIPLIIIISLSVFGGGQVFMPIFSWLWTLMHNNFGASQLTQDKIDSVFTIANTTPGVVSTKFAFFTGYLVANGEWWGYLAVFLTYLIFCLPAIFVMALAMKYVKKFKTNKYIANMLIVMKPIVAGIMIALSLQLLISILFPEVIFNKSIDEYAKLSKPGASGYDVFIAHGHGYYRNILLKIYVPVGIFGSYFLAKKKFSLFIIILINIAVSILLFAPYNGW
ncbi:chromate transporter [Mycoplasma sp. Pen4]|uniref:chromate transporter n=1 Tax=Mycoplasma sp. Pen4 TaxID=640330 RepID=UPI001654AA2A|nr:chromate transporter [Mycoplasma sp. Pen4]QNM93451.1 chromate transporter [Mycoplasma sp. Pen4]